MVDAMREMKDSGMSWIGKIPKEWSITRLKYSYDNSKGDAVRVGPFGSALPSSDYIDDGVWVYNQRTVLDENFVTNDTFVSEEKASSLNGFKVCVNDILITTRGTLGHVAIVPQNAPAGILHPCIIRFRVRDDIVIPKLLKYMFNESDIFIKQIEYTSNSTTIGALYSYNLKDLVLPQIPLLEQQAIVDFLDTKCAEIDALSADIQSEIDTLQAYKRSVITEAVTKGLDKNAPMKNSGIEWIESIPAHWSEVPFKYVLKERNEKNNPPKTDERLSLSIGLGVTTYAEKTTNLDRFKEDVSQYKLAHDGDLVMNSMNMIVGATGVSKYYGCVSPAYYIFYDLDPDHIVAKFCEYIFLTPILLGEFHKLGKGIMFIERGEGKVNTCRLKVSRYDLGKLVLPIPPIQEIRNIVKYLNGFVSEIDIMIKQKQEQLEVLADYKKSVIYEYVTGKKEIPVA